MKKRHTDSPQPDAESTSQAPGIGAQRNGRNAPDAMVPHETAETTRVEPDVEEAPGADSAGSDDLFLDPYRVARAKYLLKTLAPPQDSPDDADRPPSASNAPSAPPSAPGAPGAPGAHPSASNAPNAPKAPRAPKAPSAPSPVEPRDSDAGADDRAREAASDSGVDDSDVKRDRRSGLLQRFRSRQTVIALCLLILVVVNVLLVRSALQRDTDPAGPVGDDDNAPAGRSTGNSFVVPSPPPAAQEFGSYARSRVTQDGQVRVRQWIQSSRPLDGIRLEMPSLPDGSRARVTNVLVAADEVVVDTPRTLDASRQRLSFDAPARSVYVRYTLDGVVERSPSVPGRALIRATALDVRPRSGPSRITVVGEDVLSTSCAPTPATPRPCGEPAKGRWVVVLRGADRADTVMAQVNLT